MRVNSLKISGDSEQYNELFRFASERLNLLILLGAAESSAVIDVIVQALYQPYVETRAVPASIAGCELETSNGTRSVTVTCDFATGDSDIISGGEKCNYAKPPGPSLCGVDSATFEEIAAIDRTRFEPAESLVRSDRIATLLHRAIYGQPHPKQAIELVLDALKNYRFQGKEYQVDDLLDTLAMGKSILEARLRRLEEEKVESDGKQTVLTDLEREIADKQSVLKRQEQLQLSTELSALDKQIMVLQERAAQSSLLSAELHELGDLSAFPVDAISKVEELWSKRASTMANHAELTREVEDAEGNLCAAGDLENCQPEDAPLLYNLAGTLSNVQSELDDLTLRHSREMRRVKDAGVDFDKVSRTRQSVLSMNARDLDDANRLVLLLKTTKQKLADAVQVFQRIESDVSEAKQEFVQAVRSERRWRTALLWLSVSPVAFLIAMVAFPYSQTLPGPLREQLITVLITISITAFVFSTFVFVLLHGVRRSRSERLNRLSRECAGYAQAEAALAQELAAVNRQADMLAQRNSAGSGNELLKQVIGYAGTAEQLKDLDLLEQMMFLREKQKDKLIGEIQQLFQRARRSVAVITPQQAALLADDIQRFYESVRQTEKISSSLSNKRSELRFLAGEIADIESQLRDAFYRARLEAPEDLAQAIGDFRAKTLQYRRFQQIQEELSRRAPKNEAPAPEQKFHNELESLIAKRKDVNARLQNLLTAHPSLLEMAVEERSSSAALDEVLHQVQVLQLEYLQCQDTMCSSLRKFQDFHLKTGGELEDLDRHIRRIEHEKRAAELAVSLLEKVAQQSRLQWAELLTNQWQFLATRATVGATVAEDATVGLLGIRSISWNERLEISVCLNKEGSILGESELLRERKDIGMLVDLLLRLIVALSVCQARPVPVFVNEPFADLDDRASLAVLHLLVNLSSQMQITILTANPQRYQDLAAQLGAREQSLIHRCHAAV